MSVRCVRPAADSAGFSAFDCYKYLSRGAVRLGEREGAARLFPCALRRNLPGGDGGWMLASDWSLLASPFDNLAAAHWPRMRISQAALSEKMATSVRAGDHQVGGSPA